MKSEKIVNPREKEIDYNKLRSFSAVLGGCVVGSFKESLFITIIKLKAALTAKLTGFDELAKLAREDSGIKVTDSDRISDDTPTASIVLYQDAITKLSKEKVKVECLLLTEEDFKKLAEKNPKFSVEELELIYDLMVLPFTAEPEAKALENKKEEANS